jgi:branched-chain amino acid transport system substrate-binding protein
MHKKTVTLRVREGLIAIVVVLLLLGGIGSAFAGGAQEPVEEPFKIGALCELTGPAAAFGVETCTGKEIWVEAKNKAGGLDGRKIELITYDCETSTAGAVNGYRRLVEEGVDIIWMLTASSSIIAVKPLAAEGKIPILAGGGADAIVDPPDPWVFKIGGTMSTDYVQGLLTFAKEKGVRTVATLSATDGYGQAEKMAVEKFAPQFGITVVAQETYAPTDTDFTAQLVNIKDKNPDMLYSAAAGGPAIVAYKQIRQYGLNMPLAVSSAALNAAFFNGVGGKDKLEGVYCPANLSTFGDLIPGNSGQHYRDLTKALGREATTMEALGWDNGIATEWAYKNSDGTPQGMRDVIEGLDGLAVINGEVTMSPKKHAGLGPDDVYVGVFKGGKFVFAD